MQQTAKQLVSCSVPRGSHSASLGLICDCLNAVIESTAHAVSLFFKFNFFFFLFLLLWIRLVLTTDSDDPTLSSSLFHVDVMVFVDCWFSCDTYPEAREAR